ncbi:3-oxoacyl-ACP reductase [Pseudomonas taiwanensis]|uniref:SDR family NAD(P)-dependent oxidoreductase n=1 Tax=Pseudomonas TaxID=286 RepID=UPI0015C1B9E0|nr:MULTISPECIES: SDR family oxidoreductase [Pseudomonas]MDH4560762.1 SDR family oxidoreductase [Pseudomonas sp. BN411]MDH4653714.1 SDR family oxidoreductase [Pseudomonas sp. BN606]MDH4874111.1 SDR family oxidoreductase [Pseudomonas sp. BN515]NWL75743.1 3-oxoacyl-ACP reductase [Pseudomonas taiwanensis]
MSRLQGKVAIVTGGARGIGKCIVETFVAEGAKVVVGDINDQAADLESQLGAEWVAFKRTDVTSDVEIEALVAYAVERFGRLDIMVNNAGALGDQTKLIELDADGFTKTVTLLLRSAALGHKYAARQMIAQGQGGSIVSISSIAGIEAGWSSVSYDAAKAAVLHLARSASYELAPKQIRSNVVAPGLILTPIIGTACDVAPEHYAAFTESLEEPYGKLIPLGRAGKPKDIAEAVLFFASDASAHVTGQSIAVDGGLTSMTGFDIGGVVAQAVESFNARIGNTESGKVGWLPNRNG